MQCNLNEAFTDQDAEPIYQEIHDLLDNAQNWWQEHNQESPFSRGDGDSALYEEITPITFDDSDWDLNPPDGDPFPTEEELCRQMEDLGIDIRSDDDDDDQHKP